MGYVLFTVGGVRYDYKIKQRYIKITIGSMQHLKRAQLSTMEALPMAV